MGAGIPKLPNPNREGQPDKPKIGLTPMVGKGQTMPKWEADGCFYMEGPADSDKNMSHNIVLAMMSNCWQQATVDISKQPTNKYKALRLAHNNCIT